MHQIKEKIAGYQKENPQFKKLLDFYSSILDIHQKCLPEISPQIELTDDRIKSLIDQGEHLLKNHPIRIDQPRFKQIKDELTKLFGTQQTVLESAPSEAETANFLSFYALSPFYQKESERLKEKIDDADWLKGFCPVCGQFPRISRLRKEDGKRLLKCPLCLTEWSFARIGCPFCDNVDSSTLNYFYAGEDRTRRVYICEKCKTYLKTIDERALDKEVALEIEDIITPQLDELVKGKGYRPIPRPSDGSS